MLLSSSLCSFIATVLKLCSCYPSFGQDLVHLFRGIIFGGSERSSVDRGNQSSWINTKKTMSFQFNNSLSDKGLHVDDLHQCISTWKTNNPHPTKFHTLYLIHLSTTSSSSFQLHPTIVFSLQHSSSIFSQQPKIRAPFFWPYYRKCLPLHLSLSPSALSVFPVKPTVFTQLFSAVSVRSDLCTTPYNHHIQALVAQHCPEPLTHIGAPFDARLPFFDGTRPSNIWVPDHGQGGPCGMMHIVIWTVGELRFLLCSWCSRKSFVNEPNIVSDRRF